MEEELGEGVKQFTLRIVLALLSLGCSEVIINTEIKKEKREKAEKLIRLMADLKNEELDEKAKEAETREKKAKATKEFEERKQTIKDNHLKPDFVTKIEMARKGEDVVIPNSLMLTILIAGSTPTIPLLIFAGIAGGLVSYFADKYVEAFYEGTGNLLNNAINIINSTFFTVQDNNVVDIASTVTSEIKEDFKELLNHIDLNYGKISVQTDFTNAGEVASLANELKSKATTSIEVLSPAGSYIEQIKHDPASNLNFTGTSGNDTLIGNQGNEIFKGGRGNDYYETGGGIDEIYDSDGIGSVSFAGKTLSTASKLPNEEYFNNGSTRFYWDGDGTDLIVNDQLTIKNFQNGDLGIHLKMEKPPEPRIYTADFLSICRAA